MVNHSLNSYNEHWYLPVPLILLSHFPFYPFLFILFFTWWEPSLGSIPNPLLQWCGVFSILNLIVFLLFLFLTVCTFIMVFIYCRFWTFEIRERLYTFHRQHNNNCWYAMISWNWLTTMNFWQRRNYKVTKTKKNKTKQNKNQKNKNKNKKKQKKKKKEKKKLN